jgi:hypothetical protein
MKFRMKALTLSLALVAVLGMASGGKLLCSIQEAEQIALKAILAYADMLK